MKVFNKTISIGCIIGLLAAALSVLCGAVSARSSSSVKLNKNSMLKVNGSAILNRFGQRIALRGVNLGGWLLQESWMTPVDGEDKTWGYYDTIEILTDRFGEEKCRKLIETYEENWITESDLDYLAALGVNCVRVPFWYRNLQSDDNGTWIMNTEGKIDFSRLDYIVEECGKRGIYVILDLHGAPGFQSDDHSTGRADSGKLFSIGREGSRYRELTVELWIETAKHFNGNPAVAAYDLLNEPMNGFSAIKKCDLALWQLYDRIYKAIREVDKEHIIAFEGVWELGNLPSPVKYNWQNVVYSLHNYNYKIDEIDNKIKDAQQHSVWNVPVLIG
jgi:aryl-phospho-beta-D-glucosidase BglC (GH1 family)